MSLCQTTFNPDPTGLAPACPASGQVAGILLPANIIGPNGQGITAGEFAEPIAAVRKGVAYVNVHSTPFPGGEIRGQLDRDDWRQRNCVVADARHDVSAAR